MDWNDGERKIHELTHKFREDNPTSPLLTPRAAHMASRYKLMALGTLDSNDNPWCTVWGTGDPPLAQPVAQSVLGIRSTVDATFDPVVEELFGGKTDGEVVRESPPGHMVSGLSIELEERGRVKLYGRMIAGALNAPDELSSTDESVGKAGEAQLVVKIEQSLGNCPKYLNKKRIVSQLPEPKLLSSSPNLTQSAIDLIHNADMFFVASAHKHNDMDANHRGGPQGFLRVISPENSHESSTIVWPEYSGNNLYQTLGNLMSTPRAGLCIPDFETGDVLYLSGTTKVLINDEASNVLTKSKLAVQFTVTQARHVQKGLPFRGENIEDGAEGRSPYNPRVRYMTAEKVDEFSRDGDSGPAVTAKLVANTAITPTINRYRFALSDPSVYGPWKPGQYVALDLSQELDMGYSHMRDDDPQSLNDDFIRTFTVSSIPNSLGEHGEEFEITVRKVGSVTGFLSWHKPGMLETGIRGFGGEFRFEFGGKRIGFIAAGIGITPLLGQMGELDEELDQNNLKVFWTVGIKDANLAVQILNDFPQLQRNNAMTIYLTGNEKTLDDKDDKAAKTAIQTLKKMKDVAVLQRRIIKDDLEQADKTVDQWYLCTAPTFRKQIQEYLPGHSIIFENFDY
jgi:NAD(P)H-flavin reductase